jgi:hypothetical protein
MVNQQPFTRDILATVEQVLPATGLAYVADDTQRSWAITRSTHGSGLHTLRPGQHLDITVVNHGDFDLISKYTPRD